MTFRDDRDALLARMTALEAELDEAKAKSADAPALRQELTRIDEQLRSQITELDEDRRAMKELHAALERVRAKLAPETAAAAAAKPAAMPAARSLKIVVTLAVACLLVVLLIVMAGTRKQRASSPSATKATQAIEVRPEIVIPRLARGAVDPIALLERAAEVAGPAYQFSRMLARHVGENGLVDFEAAPEVARVDYRFIDRNHVGSVTVSVTRAGFARESGEVSVLERSVPRPACGLATLWAEARSFAAAIGSQIDGGAFAVVTYPGSATGEPGYRFEVEAQSFKVMISNCGMSPSVVVED